MVQLHPAKGNGCRPKVGEERGEMIGLRGHQWFANSVADKIANRHVRASSMMFNPSQRGFELYTIIEIGAERQDVCHVLRDHHKHEAFSGPRHFVYTAALEMHPLDVVDRVGQIKDEQAIGFCNITKCCTKVCPESITITDNAIIPLKERVVDRFYDPLAMLSRWVRGKKPS